MAESTFLSSYSSGQPTRRAVIHELRRLLPLGDGLRKVRPLGLAAIDSHLPGGGLASGALHEVVPASEAALTSALGFIVALMAHVFSPPPETTPLARKRKEKGARPYIFVMPAFGRRRHGRLSGHGLNALGLDPARTVLIETAHRKDTLWAMAEALRSAAPHAVAGMIDRLDLKTSQKLHLAANDAGLPLLLLRPASTLEASAAATRWRAGGAEAARDRFGMYARAGWHLQLERCRNGRPGEWVVEYDHVAHRFSLAAALADPSFSHGAGGLPFPRASRS